MEHYFLGGEMEDYEGSNIEGGMMHHKRRGRPPMHHLMHGSNVEGGRMHHKRRVHHLMHGSNIEGGKMHHKRRVHHLMHHPVHHSMHPVHHLMHGSNIEGGFMVGGKFAKEGKKLLLENEFYVSEDIKKRAQEGKAELKQFKDKLKNEAALIKKKPQILNLIDLNKVSLPILRKIYMLERLEEHKKDRNRKKREARIKREPVEPVKKPRKQKSPSEKKLIAAKAKATREAKKAKKTTKTKKAKTVGSGLYMYY